MGRATRIRHCSDNIRNRAAERSPVGSQVPPNTEEEGLAKIDIQTVEVHGTDQRRDPMRGVLNGRVLVNRCLI